MSKLAQKVTADQLFAMPNDGSRYELVKGELRKMTPAGGRHGAIIWEFSGLLSSHIRRQRLGQGFGAETGFKIFNDPDTVRAPDISFIKQDRLSVGGLPEKFLTTTPDLVVEVLSPRDTMYEVEEKVADWIAASVPMVLILNPKQRTVHVYRPGCNVRTLTEKDIFSGDDVVPGFQCQVSEIFPPESGS